MKFNPMKQRMPSSPAEDPSMKVSIAVDKEPSDINKGKSPDERGELAVFPDDVLVEEMAKRGYECTKKESMDAGMKKPDGMEDDDEDEVVMFGKGG